MIRISNLSIKPRPKIIKMIAKNNAYIQIYINKKHLLNLKWVRKQHFPIFPSKGAFNSFIPDYSSAICFNSLKALIIFFLSNVACSFSGVRQEILIEIDLSNII